MLRKLAIMLGMVFVASMLLAQTSEPPPAATGKSTKTKKSKPEKAIPTEFSEEIAKHLLGEIRQGLEAHNPRQMLAVFDREKMDGYFALEDRLYAYFNRYDGFRAYYRILESSTDGERGIALAEWQVEAIPASGPQQRREGQVKFEFAVGKSGWKVVEFTPRDFFQ